MNIIHNHRFKALSFLVVLLLAGGTVFYRFVESWNWVDAFYFSAITLTTVGYGDFAPVTSLGRLFTIFYLFLGIGVILGFINFIAKQRIRRRAYQRAGKDKEIKKLEEKVKKLKKRRK
jgi:voltage-gated potassium channel